MVRQLIVLTAAFASFSCVAGDLDDVAEPEIGTHVEDWRDEIVYQLLTDRFANGDARNDFRVNPDALAAYHGGDWQGVIDRLDYLEELGVTALWISPIVLNVDTDAGVDGYHGYWAVDLTRLNPHFGDLATLRAMVRAAHERGIKVILDIVTNHLGQVFYYDININGRPDDNVFGSGTRSPLSRVTEYDPDYDTRGIQAFTSLGESGPAPIRFFDMPEIWRIPPRAFGPDPLVFQRPESYNRRGRITDYGIMEQVIYGDFPGGLKDVRTEDAAVREAMIASYVHWVLQTDIDGFRIDTLKHVEHEFWQVFTREVRSRLAARGKSNFLMFGEAFDGDDVLVGSFTVPGELDSVFYFPHKFQVFNDVFAFGQPTRKIEELFNRRAMDYGTMPQPMGTGVPPRDLLVNFIDNHDVPRFLFVRDDRRALRAALAYLMTMDGVPCLYYGTEQEFRGGNDPANREDLWASGYRTDGETFRWVSRLARIRREYEALRRGTYAIRWVTDRIGTEQDAGVVAFERAVGTGGAYALVVINSLDKTSETSATLLGGGPMIVGAAPGTVLVDVLNPENRYTVGSGSTLSATVGPFAASILVPESQYVPVP